MDDCDCGCMAPVFTEPMEALRFLSARFKFAGVSHGVALNYAHDIDVILASHDVNGCAEGAEPEGQAAIDGTTIKPAG